MGHDDQKNASVPNEQMKRDEAQANVEESSEEYKPEPDTSSRISQRSKSIVKDGKDDDYFA